MKKRGYRAGSLIHESRKDVKGDEMEDSWRGPYICGYPAVIHLLPCEVEIDDIDECPGGCCAQCQEICKDLHAGRKDVQRLA